jgi:hypothetical protein
MKMTLLKLNPYLTVDYFYDYTDDFLSFFSRFFSKEPLFFDKYAYLLE